MQDFEKHKANFFSFLDSISKDDKIGIISHANCTDGMASVVFMVEILNSKGLDNYLVNFCKYGIGNLKKIEKIYVEDKINKVFILDLNADADMIDELIDFQQNFDVLFIDHHPLNPDLKIDDRVIKTHKDDCTSLILFRFGDGLIEYNKWSWLACVAGVSEFSYLKEENSKFIKKYYPDFDSSEVRKSKVFNLVSKIGSLINYYSQDSLKAYKFILEMNFNEIDRIHDEVSKEFNRCLEDFENNAERHFDGNLYFYYIKSKFSLASGFTTTLSVNHKGSTIIIFSDTEDSLLLKVSARNNGIPLKYSMNEMLKAGISGLDNAIAGGHAPASGASFLMKDMDKFKQNIIEFVKDRLQTK